MNRGEHAEGCGDGLFVDDVVGPYIDLARQRERHHQDMKQHVTATAGAAVDSAEQHTIECPSCGDRVPADEAGKLADHDRNGVACVASGWTIKGERQ